MKYLLLVAMIAMTARTMQVPDIETFQNPALARMVFWHLPCAIACSGFFLAAPYYAFRYLRTQNLAFDRKAEACMEMAFLLGALTLLTGILFSKVQWGAYWNWDPRQTSFLFVQLIMGAYFAIRSALGELEKRAANSGAYLLAAMLPTIFLIFVYPRLTKTLHPNVVQDGSLDTAYKTTFYGMLLLVSVVGIWLVRQRLRAGDLEIRIQELEDTNGELATSHHPADSGVVRPIPVQP